MSDLAALSISLLLLLAAFPLISFGATYGPPIVWLLGLVLLLAGGLIPPVRRFLPSREPEAPPTRAGLAEDERSREA